MLKFHALQAIEKAIMNLSKEDAYQLSLWLHDYLDDEWDQLKKVKNDLWSVRINQDYRALAFKVRRKLLLVLDWFTSRLRKID